MQRCINRGNHCRERPGLNEALAAVRAGGTLVVTKLYRFARPLPDVRDIIADMSSGARQGLL